MYQVEILADAGSVAAVKDEWRDLADACAAGPFGRPDYAMAWWRCLGRGRLLVVTARRDGRLVGLAPLHERRYGPLRRARWLGHGLGSVSELLVRPGSDDVAVALWDALRRPWRMLELVEYRDDGAGLLALRRAAAWRPRLEVRDLCPVVDLDDTVEAFLSRPDRRRVRTALRTGRKHLDRAGLELTVEVVGTPDRFHQVLPELTAVSDAAENANPRLNFFRPPWRDFTTSYLTAATGRGEALVFLARVDGQPVSLHVCLPTPPVLHHWITRFDPVARLYSPGHSLVAASYEWAVSHGFSRLDLLLGDDEHKRQWSTGSYDTLAVTALPVDTPAVTLAHLGLDVTGEAVHLLRRVAQRWHR